MIPLPPCKPTRRNPIQFVWVLILVSALTVCASPVVLGVQSNEVAEASGNRQLVLIVGAPGEAKYQEMFDGWAKRWTQQAIDVGMKTVRIGDAETKNDLVELKKFFEALPTSDEVGSHHELWIVLIGHGTFDGDSAKFNLNGPDISSTELDRLLTNRKEKIVFFNCASSSGPFLNHLSRPGRIVVTATKSGSQYNFAFFGKFLAASIGDDDADLDKDGQTSVLEAFLAASSRVAEFYESENRLRSEQALLDDNGDALGTAADWFQGTRAVKVAKKGAQPDGIAANQVFLKRSVLESSLSPEQRKRRDTLEEQLEQLRGQKGRMDEATYLDELEVIFVKLAKMNEDR